MYVCTTAIKRLLLLLCSYVCIRLLEIRYTSNKIQLTNACSSCWRQPCRDLQWLVQNCADALKYLRLQRQTHCVQVCYPIPPRHANIPACDWQPGVRHLEELQELDLDGNPCARSWGYKHRVVHSCPPGLSQLDGEEVSQLDRDLSELFFEEEQNRIDILRGATDIGVDKDRLQPIRSGEGRYRSGGGSGGRPAAARTSTRNNRRYRGEEGRSMFRGRREKDSIEVKGTGSKLSEEPHDRCSSGGVDAREDGARLMTSDRLNNDPYVSRRAAVYYLLFIIFCTTSLASAVGLRRTAYLR